MFVTPLAEIGRGGMLMMGVIMKIEMAEVIEAEDFLIMAVIMSGTLYSQMKRSVRGRHLWLFTRRNADWKYA
jgi:hypothetical protein